ncbi:hypothetical protein HHI36_023577 [Cryptolaemus montrouzieri]|uniref:Uncharacterized protein n=1 Tax=Cryptolaemus montrouzieri TaxID=559131 RepID=A0ABD2PGU2_9CUCU
MSDFKCFLLVFIHMCHVTFAQVGNTCYMRTTGTPGICKISSDCPEAEEQGRNGIAPTVCGHFQSTVPIVCCAGTFSNGDFHSPSRPINSGSSNSFSNVNEDEFYNNHNRDTQSRPEYSSSNGDDNLNYNGNRPIHSRPTENSNIFYTDDPDTSFSNSNNNYFNGDSIVYPSDSGSNNIPRKSEAKCLEYTKPFNDVVQAIPLLTDTEVVNIQVEKCGNNGVPLIVGGAPADPGEFPFMAVLGFDSENGIEWRCGATLISEFYIITAAHCTFSRDANQPVVVRLGSTDLTKFDTRQADHRIANIIAHPNYTFPQGYNDIALIKLRSKVTFTEYIRPACLYTSYSEPPPQCIATGFGKEEFAAADITNKLMKVALNIYNNSKCARTFANENRVYPRGIVSTMICAGEINGGRDTCQGDSGGPLLVTEKRNHCKFYLIGITSTGKSCGEVNTPAIYTKVSEYLSWIEDIVWDKF